MNKVKEILGVYGGVPKELTEALEKGICPYSHKKCFKVRKSSPETVIGTCTVEYRNENVVICPNRLLERNQIFIDCIHLLTLHEPGNELYVLPEITVPGGTVDYFLVSVKAGKIRDFVGLEIQTLDTIGTIWPERQRLLKNIGFSVDESDVSNVRNFGMNWKMTAKTILVQLRHKSETFEFLGKRLVLVVQNPLFNYLTKTFDFSHIEGVRNGDSVHIHSYSLTEERNRLKLSLHKRVGTDASGIAKCLGLNVPPKIELEELLKLLESKLKDEYRLTIL